MRKNVWKCVPQDLMCWGRARGIKLLIIQQQEISHIDYIDPIYLMTAFIL